MHCAELAYIAESTSVVANLCVGVVDNFSSLHTLVCPYKATDL